MDTSNDKKVKEASEESFTKRLAAAARRATVPRDQRRSSVLRRVLMNRQAAVTETMEDGTKKVYSDVGVLTGNHPGSKVPHHVRVERSRRRAKAGRATHKAQSMARRGK